jgi:nucleoside-diphosphate-sugar epimerase
MIPRFGQSSVPSGGGQPNTPRSFDGKVLVTGATGHVGANVVRRLLADGRDVRVLLEPGARAEAVEGLAVERVTADITDIAALEKAMQGCKQAFHIAAIISTVVPNPALERRLYDVNVTGTQNLLRVAKHQGMDRVVVTGSFSANGFDREHPQAPADETYTHYPFDEVLPYSRTKVLVEHEVLKAAVEGLDVVIATSCAVLGPHDYVPSRMGRTLLDFAHGKLRAYVPGGFEFIAARDIAEGHVLAMQRGRSGQKYVFSSRFVSIDEMMGIWEEVTGKKRPRLRLPPPVMAGVAEVTSFVLDRVAPNVPQRLTPAAVRILRSQRRADTTKARSELGFRPTRIEDAIQEGYDDFVRRGLAPKGPRTTFAVTPAKGTKNVSAEKTTEVGATA